MRGYIVSSREEMGTCNMCCAMDAGVSRSDLLLRLRHSFLQVLRVLAVDGSQLNPSQKIALKQ